MSRIVDADALKNAVSFRDYVRARWGEPHQTHYRYSVWDAFRIRHTTGASPSFTVWDTYNGGAGYAKDFGTGKTYDIYDFIQLIDGVDFKGAVQSLAEWAGGHPVARVSEKQRQDSQIQYKPVTWQQVERTQAHYSRVKSYIELMRRIDGKVAHDSRLGGLTWGKTIRFGNKTERIPVNRATFPYFFGDAVHGWVSRRDDLTFLERVDFEFRGIIEATRHRIWNENQRKNPSAKLSDVNDSHIIDAIRQDMWTPEELRDKFNATSLRRWHQYGRRSIFNVDPFCRIVDGVYRWSVPSVAIHESETDALACQSAMGCHVAHIAYKVQNRLNIPLWKIFGKQPIAIYIAVQNDEASRNYARQLAERLTYSKENYGVSNYTVSFLYTPEDYKDFGECQQQNKLRDYFSFHELGLS